MNPNETQANNQMTADQSAAALAFATQLQEQMMPQMEQPMEETSESEPTESSVEPETAPEQEQTPEVEKEPAEDKTAENIENLSKEFENFKGEVKGIIESQMGNLTQTIKDALQD